MIEKEVSSSHMSLFLESARSLTFTRHSKVKTTNIIIRNILLTLVFNLHINELLILLILPSLHVRTYDDLYQIA